MEKKLFDVEVLRSVLKLTCILDDLKTRIRSGWLVWRVSSDRLESVYEHCQSCLILANALYPLYPDRDKINLARVNSMLIWHEIGESIIGDVPLVDKKHHEEKHEQEHEAWKKLLEGLPYEQEVYDLLMEFDDHEEHPEEKTPDAKFAFYIDKFDAMKTMKRYNDSSCFYDLDWIMEHSAKVDENKDIQELVKNGAKTPIDIWFAERYIPFKDDEFFMEAQRIIREMNTNIAPPKL